MKLNPNWLSWPETKTLIAAFAEYPGSLKFVGGAVRDSLLGRPVHEVDGATTRYPGEVMSLAIRHGLRAIPTGLEHGTVTIVINKRSFEITTLRKDIKTDGRHAEVVFTDSWQEDAKRRDFTMNALYLSPDGELFDDFAGVSDAKHGRVAFIGDAEARINEDYLRILRFFRFYAHYGKTLPDSDALAACKKHAAKLKTLPAERIWQELSKLLAASRASDALQLMHEHGVLSYVLGFDIPSTDKLKRLEEIGAVMGLTISKETKLAALMQSTPAMIKAETLADHLKCPNVVRKNMEHLQAHAPNITLAMSKAEQKKLIRHLGHDLALQALALAWASSNETITHTHPYHAMLEFMRGWQVPEFPVSGNDLLLMGRPAGKTIGEELAKLETFWEASDYQMSKDELLKRCE